jgi:ubiquitin carboxyl-terminal hydrolase 4/11/15
MFGGAFTLIPVSNRGIEKPSLFANNDRPLHLKEKEHVALLWTKENKKKYLDSRKWKDVEKDPSAVIESNGSGKRRGAETLPLSECLRLYSVQEQLGVDDKWYCSECKDHVQAFKKIEVWTAPKILLIHLKRFNYRGRYNFRDRLDHLVDFPLEGLDMSQYVLGASNVPPIYDLFAVSNHYGSMGGGHYTAYARHRDDGKWHLYDDSSVREVSDLSSIVSEAAYILLYRRRDVSWPPFNRSLEIVESDDEDSDDADSDDEVEEKPASAPVRDAPEAPLSPTSDSSTAANVDGPLR